MTCFENAMKRDDLTRLQEDMVAMSEGLMNLAKSTAIDGQALALMGIVTEDGTKGIAMVGDLFTEEARAEAPAMLRTLLSGVKAKAYVLMSESWMLPREATETMKEAFERAKATGEQLTLERPISQDDRRISIVSLSGESVEGDVLFAAFKIDEAHGRVIDLEKEEVFFVGKSSSKTKAQGRLSGLLRKQEVEIELPSGARVRNVVTRGMVREAAEVMGWDEEEIEKITKARGLEIVEDVGEESVLVCMTDDRPPQHDNPVERGQCSRCGRGIYYSPQAPQVKRRVCLACAGVMAEEVRG